MPDITITSPDTHGKTPIGVNGVTRDIKHNTRTSVSDAEVEVLQNADLGTGKLVVHEDETDDAAQATSTVDEAMKIGTEGSHIQAPASPADTSTERNPLVEGEGGNLVDNNKVGGDDEIGGKPVGSEVNDEQEPVEGDDDAAFLDKPIREIDVSSIEHGARIDSLIALEQKRQDPRSTLIEKLEARKAQIGA